MNRKRVGKDKSSFVFNMCGKNVNNCSTQTSLNLPCVNISWQNIALDKGKLQASQFAKTDREEQRMGRECDKRRDGREKRREGWGREENGRGEGREENGKGEI